MVTCMGMRRPSLAWAYTMTGTWVTAPVTIDRVQGAVLLPAQPAAVLVHVAENVLEALRPTTSCGRPARDALGGRAPVGDPAVDVAYVDAVAQLSRMRSAIPACRSIQHLPFLHGPFGS